MKKIVSLLMVVVATISFNFINEAPVKADTTPTRQMEKLDRGLVAVKTDQGVFLSWRLLGTEELNIPFNIYRDGVKITENPITSTTNYLDKNGAENSKYYIRAVTSGEDKNPSKTVSVLQNNYLSVNLDKPKGGTVPGIVTTTGAAATVVPYEYNANDALLEM